MSRRTASTWTRVAILLVLASIAAIWAYPFVVGRGPERDPAERATRLEGETDRVDVGDRLPPSRDARPPAPARTPVEGARAEPEPEPGAVPAARRAGEDAEDDAWRALLERIRRARSALDPHRAAWPDVVALGRLAREDRADAERAGPVPDGPTASSDTVVASLEVRLRDPAEPEFVRGAVLMALGIALPREQARALASERLDEPPGELARAAWLVLGTTARGDGDVVELDLDGFLPRHSRTGRSIWPATVRADAAEADAGELAPLDQALPHLLPADLFVSTEADARRAGNTARERAIDEGVLTRETIVLALLSTGAARPGEIRDRLLEWSFSSDMSRACLWSLCVAARDDPDLANELAARLREIGLFSPEGRMIAELLSGVSGRGDLVYDQLAAELELAGGRSDARSFMQQVGALNAIGAIVKVGDSELAREGARLLVDVAVDRALPEDLRTVTLVQLGVAAPARLRDVIEAILVSPDSAEVKDMAVTMARSVPVEDQESMRRLLMDTYRADLSADLREEYVRSLMHFGGDAPRAFLRSLAGTGDLDQALADEVIAWLSG